MTHEVGRKYCARLNCKRYFTPHQWGNYQAQKKGWFLQKDGTAWCPEHNPDWVAEWRAGKNKF